MKRRDRLKLRKEINGHFDRGLAEFLQTGSKREERRILSRTLDRVMESVMAATKKKRAR